MAGSVRQSPAPFVTKSGILLCQKRSCTVLNSPIALWSISSLTFKKRVKIQLRANLK
ncbi:hypothetical protein COLO4_01570 [Corchorus olitorius]|uniref:Uncharacterized protein n=1 Tax=Corchorus olitorius TaxID=93759 RepID=A0A1R3L2D0_9ROSI|nr:hypothetical protein COLO4_01570 [Corchorus olitorius]